jgi:hypothetical protein
MKTKLGGVLAGILLLVLTAALLSFLVPGEDASFILITIPLALFLIFGKPIPYKYN